MAGVSTNGPVLRRRESSPKTCRDMCSRWSNTAAPSSGARRSSVNQSLESLGCRFGRPPFDFLMKDRGKEPMMENRVQFHRVLRAAPEKVYRAFLDAEAMAKWLPPNGFTGKVHQMDAKVGGSYKMSFTNFSTGKSHSFGGTYVELKPHERIRYTDKFDDPNLPGEMQTTITLKKVSCGTELNVVQEGVPGVIPAEACDRGWEESLILLSKLVEADIPDLTREPQLL